MNPDGCEQAGVGSGEEPNFFTGNQVQTRDQYPVNPCIPGPLEHLSAIDVKFLKIQMAVGIGKVMRERCQVIEFQMSDNRVQSFQKLAVEPCC